MAKNAKDELIAEIANTRILLSRSMDGLRRNADVGARMKASFVDNKALWLGGAGVTGWILSRLPARRKKTKAPAGKMDGQIVKELAGAGLLAGLLKFLLTLFRPAITAFATQKIAELAGGNRRWKK